MLQVAQAISYNPVVLVLAMLTVAATNLVLNFNDLFLMSVSIVIVHRFRDLRTRISKAVSKVRGASSPEVLQLGCCCLFFYKSVFLFVLQAGDDSYWRLARENFNGLSRLTRKVDRHLNFLMLLSCLNNFFSICIQLQHAAR